MGLAFGLCVFVPMLLNYMLPIYSGHGQDEERRMGERWGERGTREVCVCGGGWDGHQPYVVVDRSLALPLPSLSPDNLCRVADETHSHSCRPDCQNKLAFLWKVIDRLKGYKLGACSSFLLQSRGLFAADSPRPKIKWTQAGLNGRALIE